MHEQYRTDSTSAPAFLSAATQQACRRCKFTNAQLQGTYFIKAAVPYADFEVSLLSISSPSTSYMWGRFVRASCHSWWTLIKPGLLLTGT